MILNWWGSACPVNDKSNTIKTRVYGCHFSSIRYSSSLSSLSVQSNLSEDPTGSGILEPCMAGKYIIGLFIQSWAETVLFNSHHQSNFGQIEGRDDEGRKVEKRTDNLLRTRSLPVQSTSGRGFSLPLITTTQHEDLSVITPLFVGSLAHPPSRTMRVTSQNLESASTKFMSGDIRSLW